MIQTAEVITTLTNAIGLSGYEAQIHALLKSQFAPLSDDVRISKVGSVHALKRGTGLSNCKRRTIMLAAHVDEIGLIVTGLDHGFLRIAGVGGSDARILLGQSVLVHPAQGKPVPGLIASRPPHVLPADQRNKVITIDSLFVDTGLTEAQAKRLFQVGDRVSYDVQTTKLKGDLMTGKAMDDRVAVVTMLVCLEELQKLKHVWDVVAVSTAGEETTMAGARTSSYALEPDAAIAIDVTFAAQHDYVSSIELGKGPVITIGPNYHPRLTKRLMDTAKRMDMNYQVEAELGGGTDAWAIQVSREGVPTALLGVPLRYMHSPVETVNVKDVERIGRLMAHTIADLNDEI